MAITYEFNSWFWPFCILTFLLWVALKFLKLSSSRENDVSNGRPLDFLEKYIESASILNDGQGNICCAVSLSSKQSLSFQNIYDSLVLLVKRQPMLRCVISTKNDGELYYDIKNVEDAILLFDITKSDDKISDWKDLIYKHTSKVHNNKLSWKAAVLEQEYNPTTQVYLNMIMFAFKHSCIDGISIIKFVEQFINTLNEISSGVSNVHKEITSLKLLPSGHSLVIQDKVGHKLFQFIITCFGFRPILTFLLKQMISYTFKNKAPNLFYKKHPPISWDRSVERLEMKTFTKEETKLVVKGCKANGCTVTGAITAAIHLAFYHLLDEKDTTKLHLESRFVFNNRSYGNQKAQDDYLGVFVYSLLYNMMYSQPALKEFWTMAKESSVQLKQLVKNQAFVRETTLMASSALDPKILANLPNENDNILKSTSNLISSYGVFDFDNPNAASTIYKVENCFIHGIFHNTDVIFRHHICTVNGKLTWMIKCDATISEDHLKQLSNLCFKELINNCSIVNKE
ncbi:uncharacterized protein LOC124455549 [Xenia sp. Carnegie-2017]|uniref:uncharacterized protein LOC124455549 n=1 Tax=Xenia sp. Carnegie-2017 TaxID=2897299 RepID=UPI001F044205|nr:uncharacterized protein LOC124455549 [Xenia sp. Carnegie-2017]